MHSTMANDLVTFLRARIDAATRDKALYERDGARLNSQLLQGEINMGTAVLAWLEKYQQGQAAADDEEEEVAEAVE